MKLLDYFLDMMSRKALRRAAAQSNPNCLGSSSARKASSFPPAEIAAAMRLQGPTRVQNHDFLHVFSDTKKPAVSGPLAIGNFIKIKPSRRFSALENSGFGPDNRLRTNEFRLSERS